MASAIKMYHLLFTEAADARVKDWPLMSGPIPGIFILLTYLYAIKIWLPEYMKNRQPYDLKTIINVYNVFQVIANYTIFKGILTSGWLTTIHLGCVMPDYSTNPEPMRMAYWMWMTLLIKFVELIETVFFVLRKKDNQASFLHIYHHVITVSVMWMGVKYTPGGMASLPPLINTFVHVIMYSYYLLSSIADTDLKKKLNQWKMWITIVQMIQFTIMAVHSLQALMPSCPAPRFMVYAYLPNVVFVYYLFWDFFKNTYNKKTQQQQHNKSH